MAKDKPLTKTILVKTLKEMGMATKGDVRQIVGEEIGKRKLATKGDVRQIVSQEISQKKLATKDDLKNFATKDDLKNFPTKGDLKKELGKSEYRLERRIVIRMNKMERDFRQSIADLAETTPTRQEFEELKQRVGGRYGFV